MRKYLLATCLSAVALCAAGYAYADDEHFVAGITAFKAGNYQEASTQLKQSLDTSPTATTALYLGNAYLKLGRLGQAKRALKQALHMDVALSTLSRVQVELEIGITRGSLADMRDGRIRQRSAP